MYDYSPIGLDLELAKSARKTPSIELPKQQSSAPELIISGDLPGPASPAWDPALEGYSDIVLSNPSSIKFPICFGG